MPKRKLDVSSQSVTETSCPGGDAGTEEEDSQMAGSNMDGVFNTLEIQEYLNNNDIASAVKKIKRHLDQQDQIPLNIVVTGETSSGKSTFINAFRGINDDDEGAAPTGCGETTTKVKPYLQPVFPSVVLWDLPGIATPTFSAAEYLEKVELEEIDFFIIISADRFTENDVNLAKEIQRMEKKFYFVRSKIDNDIRAAGRKKNFNEKQTLEKIKNDCIQGLQNKGVENPQVFLVSSFELHLYDFQLLQETLEKELPAHKRAALLKAMPNTSLEIINKKKEAFKANIAHKAILSALSTWDPVPGVSTTINATILLTTAQNYKNVFGLDDRSLQNLSRWSNVPVEDLRAEIKSPLATMELSEEFIVDVLSASADHSASNTVEVSRIFPISGTTQAALFSANTIITQLSLILIMLADDAQRVFRRALGLDTSV